MRCGLVFLAACGRLGFDAQATSDSGGDGVMAKPVPCPIGTTAPAQITVSGRALNGALNDIPGVLVTAKTALAGTTLGTATTDINGRYSIAISTGGVPLPVFATLENSGYFTSIFWPEQPYDADLSLGASFIGTGIGVDSLYSTAGQTRDPARGQIYINVEDCAGNAIAGATISVTPAAGRYMYSNSFGAPIGAATMTASTGTAWALNVPAGPVTLTASKAGETFLALDLEVLAGSNFMGTRMRSMTP